MVIKKASITAVSVLYKKGILTYLLYNCGHSIRT